MQEYHPCPEALPPVNGYSHAVAFTGRMIAISGQVPATAAGRLVGDDLETQVRQVFENLRTALAAAGARLDQIEGTSCERPDAHVCAAADAHVCSRAGRTAASAEIRSLPSSSAKTCSYVSSVIVGACPAWRATSMIDRPSAISSEQNA